MVLIRRIQIEDLHQMQDCNLWCLPENYTFKYYFFHYLSGPQILYVAVDDNKVVGYVMAKIEEDENNIELVHGHITSISVLRTHRRLGIANKLMRESHKQMTSIYNCQYVSLHVRVTNQAAFNLYHHNLQYEIHDIEEKYYADGENAYNMRKYFVDKNLVPDNNNNLQLNKVKTDLKQQTSLLAKNLDSNLQITDQQEDEQQIKQSNNNQNIQLQQQQQQLKEEDVSKIQHQTEDKKNKKKKNKKK